MPERPTSPPDQGKIDQARRALEKYIDIAKRLEKEVDPEKRDEARRSAAAIRKAISELESQIPEEFREEFIHPTKIYLETILQLDTQIDINGMMHITGGAFTKLKDILDNNDAIITKDHKLKPHSIFNELYSRGVCDEDMYKTFNCGIGFIFSVPGVHAYMAIAGLDAAIIGEIVPGNGKVKIQSMFSNKEVEY